MIAMAIVLGAIVAIIGPIMWYTIVYYNQPKWAIPPPYRSAVGVVELRRSRGELARYRKRAIMRNTIIVVTIGLVFGLAIAFRSH